MKSPALQKEEAKIEAKKAQEEIERQKRWALKQKRKELEAEENKKAEEARAVAIALLPPDEQADLGPATREVLVCKAGKHFLTMMVHENGFPRSYVLKETGNENRRSFAVENGNAFNAFDKAAKEFKYRLLSPSGKIWEPEPEIAG